MKRLENSRTSVIQRMPLLDSAATDGSEKTGLDETSSGLVIEVLANNAASPTSYTQAGGTIEDITTTGTLGVYEAPTATKCRFEVVETGLYEFQFANALFTTCDSAIITVYGATGLAKTRFEIHFDTVNAIRDAVHEDDNSNRITLGSFGYRFNLINSGTTTLSANVKQISDGTTAADNLELACDNYSAERGLAGTALPAAAADAPGGLPISDAGGLDLDALASSNSDVITTGTAQAGTSTTIQLASAESFADDELNGNAIVITGGTGAGQSRVITDYTGSTDTATVGSAWTTTPDATSTYAVLARSGGGQNITTETTIIQSGS